MAARRSKYGPSIQYSGPFFEKDIRKTFRANARTLVSAIAEDGERMVRSELPRSDTAPHYADFVVGSAGKLPGVKGKAKWDLTAAVRNNLYIQQGYKGYGAFLESGMRGAVKTRYAGLWVYRRVGNALRRGSKAARADLTKGLN